MGFLLNRARDVCPNVINVHLPISGVARNHAYISMKKVADGEPHLAAFNLMAYSPATKHVFIVDDDIDVTNEADVLGIGNPFPSRQGSGGHKQFNRQPVEPANLWLPAGRQRYP
jgi:hypothetical protein